MEGFGRYRDDRWTNRTSGPWGTRTRLDGHYRTRGRPVARRADELVAAATDKEKWMSLEEGFPEGSINLNITFNICMVFSYLSMEVNTAYLI